MGTHTIDSLFKTYDTVLTDLLDQQLPLRTVRRQLEPMAPWFASDCVDARRKVRSLESGDGSRLMIQTTLAGPDQGPI